MSFAPTDSTDYTAASETAQINVDRAVPVASLNPVNLAYGTPLANSQLTGRATWTVGGNQVTVPGSWSFTTAAGTVLGAGDDQGESVTFTPTDSADYSSAAATATINVAQARPGVNVDPVNLTYGTPLANSQLNGTATWTVGSAVVTVAGSWSYAGVAGRVLSAGRGQSEPVTFTPTDYTDYSTVTTTVAVNPEKVPQPRKGSNPEKVPATVPPSSATPRDPTSSIQSAPIFGPTSSTL